MGDVTPPHTSAASPTQTTTPTEAVTPSQGTPPAQSVTPSHGTAPSSVTLPRGAGAVRALTGLQRSPAESTMSVHRALISRLRGAGLVLIFCVVFVIMWSKSPFFFTTANLVTALSVVSILGMMAVAETLLVFTGEIDISIGSVMAMTSVLIGLLSVAGLNIWLASAIALIAAALIGLLNGLITVKLNIYSLITTLGTYSIFLGIAYAFSNYSTVSLHNEGFKALGGSVIGIPVPVFVFVILWLLGAFIARFTALGRYIYATGDNRDAALRAGIPQGRIRIGLFVATSLSAGVAGVIVTAQLGAAAPQIGDSYLLSVVTAVILGGASLTGGRGTMFGTLVAVAILGVLQNGFALLQFSTSLQNTALGILLIFAVLTDQLVRKLERA
jgi:ribose transport system permease protein